MKNRPSIIQNLSLKIAKALTSNTIKSPKEILSALREYGVLCWNEGYNTKHREHLRFRNLRKKRIDRSFKKVLDKLDDLIQENKQKQSL